MIDNARVGLAHEAGVFQFFLIEKIVQTQTLAIPSGHLYLRLLISLGQDVLRSIESQRILGVQPARTNYRTGSLGKSG